MPLSAEEITCPACQLEIVFYNERGELMIQMVALEDPTDISNPVVSEYQRSLAVESGGGMYMPRYLPIRASRADVITLPDGTLGVRYSNMVTVNEIRNSDR